MTSISLYGFKFKQRLIHVCTKYEHFVVNNYTVCLSVNLHL